MKFILGIIIGALVIVFMVQNVELTNLKFLAWTLSISSALLILIVFVVGVLLGWIIRSLGYRRKLKGEKQENKVTA